MNAREDYIVDTLMDGLLEDQGGTALDPREYAEYLLAVLRAGGIRVEVDEDYEELDRLVDDLDDTEVPF